MLLAGAVAAIRYLPARGSEQGADVRGAAGARRPGSGRRGEGCRLSPSPKTEEARRPGRPRSARADAAIVAATLDLLFHQGFAGLSIEEVAKQAGISKATIYRRFPSKVDLVISSLRWIGLPEDQEPDDTGTFEGDFRAIGDRIAADRKRTGIWRRCLASSRRPQRPTPTSSRSCRSG